jgi:hypothetical protein
VLTDIETRLGELERAQSDITRKVLRTIQIMQERYDNVGVVDVIKRNIRQGIKEEA